MIAMSEYKDEGVIKLIFKGCGLEMDANRPVDADIRRLINSKDEDCFNSFYQTMMNENHDCLFYEGSGGVGGSVDG